MSGSKLFRAALAALAFVFGTAATQAQTQPTVTSLAPDLPKREIFIGNSFFYYNNGMPDHLVKLERAAEAEHQKEDGAPMVTIGGSGLDWHDIESYFRPDGIGAYSFDPQNNVVFNPPGKRFDAAVMMDCSQCPIHTTLKTGFTEFTGKDSEIVRGHDAKPVFFMSWAYEDRPEMTAGLAD